MASKISRPVSKKLVNLPLPPKNAEVVQKLQPIGQPTDGIMVAAVDPRPAGQLEPHHAVAESGRDLRMLDRLRRVLIQERSHPGRPLLP